MKVRGVKVSGVRYWVIDLPESGVVDRGDLDGYGGPSPDIVTIADVDPCASLAIGPRDIAAGYVVTWRRPIMVGVSGPPVRLILVEGIHKRG